MLALAGCCDGQKQVQANDYQGEEGGRRGAVNGSERHLKWESRGAERGKEWQVWVECRREADTFSLVCGVQVRRVASESVYFGEVVEHVPRVAVTPAPFFTPASLPSPLLPFPLLPFTLLPSPVAQSPPLILINREGRDRGIQVAQSGIFDRFLGI